MKPTLLTLVASACLVGCDGGGAERSEPASADDQTSTSIAAASAPAQANNPEVLEPKADASKSDENAEFDKLPGAKGPLYEFVGEAGPRVTGADVGVDVNDPKPDSPPKTRTLPSGSTKLYIAVKFEMRPQADSLSINIYNNDGEVEIGSGIVLQDENNATGEYTLTMARNPAAGKFEDGPYQARVELDGNVVALVNWEVGESK